MSTNLSAENLQQLANRAVELAAQLLTAAQAQQTAAEKRQAARSPA
ncbi:MAG: hypothetical protein R2911_17575 [Caldilineaceae bacterium]